MSGCWVCCLWERARECVCVREGCEAPVPGRRAYWRRLNTRTMGSFDQNDTPKTCGLLSPWQPPMGQRAGWQLERRTYKNGVHFFPLKLSRLYIFSPLPPGLLYTLALVNAGYISFYSSVWLTLQASLATYKSSRGKNKLRIRANNKSALYWLSLLSVIRVHWASQTNTRLSHKISHSLCSWFYASF